MKLFKAHFRAILLGLTRNVAFMVPTVLFPSMLFLFFGLGKSDAIAPFVLASFAVFGTVGVTFYQFGVGLAEDRSSAWEGYLRVLPVPVSIRFAARIAVSLIVAGITIIILGIIAGVAGVGLSATQWVYLALALLFGALPFGLFGMALGYWMPPKAAVPIANLIFLPLSYLGALWMPPDRLPDAVAAISPYTPTRMFGEIAWAAVGEHSVPMESIIGLLIYGAVFAAALWIGYARCEKEFYR